jgi:spermidine synthase
MKIAFPLALIISAATAFIALGYELVWARICSFATGSRGEAFGTMLGSYLLGLAAGSLWSRKWQQPSAQGDAVVPRRALARIILAANMVAFLVVPVAVRFIVHLEGVSAFPLRTLALVSVASAGFGLVLPLLCHYAIPGDAQSGARTSLLYLSNIIGSGAGSLLTGFVLMDWIETWQLAGVLLGAALVFAMVLAWRVRRWADVCLWSAAALLVVSSGWLHHDLFARLFYRLTYGKTSERFERVVETRHGVITVDTARRVYGGGVYDGVINTQLAAGSGLVRPYFVAALHERPRDVLVIGVSGGAWTQILAHHPHVETVTAVEINHGYLSVIQRYPEVASLLRNPKVSLIIDDGRRWLRRNPERRFDVIVMNTTFHWREFASALLSKEFLELARSHLKPDGIVMWNCTGSARAVRTGMEVFPHTMMVMNNCVGSMAPLVPNVGRWKSVLEQYQIDGRPVFDINTAAGRAKLDDVLTFLNGSKMHPGGWRVLSRNRMERFYGNAPIITDDNLGGEFSASVQETFGITWP